MVKRSFLVGKGESLRETASQIKDHTLAHLGYYLRQFAEQAQAHGVSVHWARDGEEHNRIIHAILTQARIKLMVKSKSMLTEECGPNDYLISQGLEVVDTDLGERIVQLADEPPSHIVAPAIHKKKEEISELFVKEMNSEPGNADPYYLVQIARHHLRHYLARPHAALTGVNFAIAETGGVVVCTNEGNSDMGTHLADVQIHSMGIEKLIPLAEHLGVFTRLLARSGTGQPITIYTSHYHRPLPGKSMHIVIVDNQRSSLVQKPHYRQTLKCIRCGACMNTCPVYRRSGGYSYHATIPGPIGSVLNPQRHPTRRHFFPEETRRVFLTHTRPEPMLGALRRLDAGPSRTSALGFINRGGTLDVFGMLFANHSTWAHALEAAARILGCGREEFLSEVELTALDGRGDPNVLRVAPQ